jgi:MFS transporter, DHA1 family, multidrug resistance protein
MRRHATAHRLTGLIPPTDASLDTARHAPLGTTEFVAAIACLMALTALATDVMLAVLPDIARSLDVADDNRRQLVVGIFLAGFGAGQLIVGSISDSFGRRPVLIAGLMAYVLFGALCALATDYEVLLAARLVQGLAAAVPRVVCVSIVRDCYSGARMARVLSLASMILIMVPIAGPYLGQVLAAQFSWRAPFLLLALYGAALAIWMWLRMPETSRSRQSMSFGRVVGAAVAVLRNRQSAGYIAAGGAMYGALFALILSGQQILGEGYALGAQFPLAFAALAICAVATSLLNSLLVGRLGMRLISHAAVLAFLMASSAMWALATIGLLGLPAFLGLAACCMALLSLIFANFNTLAMEPWSENAGAASSLLGAGTTLIASLLGYVIGQAYDGSAGPLAAGFIACAVIALAAVLVTERGRLFRPPSQSGSAATNPVRP